MSKENLARLLGVAALVVYSVILVSVEVGVSQEYVRNFFTEIRGPEGLSGPPRYLYAMNTTVSVAFLWSTALIFAVCALCVTVDRRYGKDHLFYLSQVPVFAFLAFDDRFEFHEHFGARFGINEIFILGVLGVVEIILLLTLGGLLSQTTERKFYIGAAGSFFVAMILIDTFAPSEAIPRLSLEDLSKTWGGAFLFLFAWSICRDKIAALKRGASSKEPD